MESVNNPLRNGGIYIHVPYCRSRCLYCDFYSTGAKNADWPRLVDAYLTEFDSRAAEWCGFEEITIYIGGGTPSLIPDREFRRLAGGLRSRLERRCGVRPSVVEFTIEVNPDDVSGSKAAMWRDSGVDRISMGVQSFCDNELRAVGRRHDAAAAERAYAILRPLFSNISLDLIFGLPQQTLSSLEYSLGRIVELAPEHVSVYSLTFEERSALTRLRDAGKVTETDEDLSGRMYSMIHDRLGAAGIRQYEISNYCREGFRSRHNSGYWHGVPYVGIGPAAHSYDGVRTRRSNVADASAYLSVLSASPGLYYETEILDDEELREEMLLTALRTVEGLDLDEYGCRFGARALADLRRAASPHMSSGNLRVHNRRLCLTAGGVMVSDSIIADLF